MSIRNGHSSNRRHGHNYIREQADARLQEVIRPAKQRGMNALHVDSYEVMYYRRADSSMPCTCQKAPALPSTEYSAEHGQLPEHVQPVIDFGDDEITIDHNESLFGTERGMVREQYGAGEPGMAGGYSDDEEIIEDDYEGRSQSKLFALSTDCGICYRNGMLPGYELYGYDRKVLTTPHVAQTYGYTIAYTDSPATFNIADPKEGYVDFEIDVPKYFQKVRYSIRDNGNHLPDEVLYISSSREQVLTLSEVRAYAGQKLLVRCRTEKFTHVVFDFDLGVEPVIIQKAQDNKATDWTMFDTIGTMGLTLPNTIDSVETSDVLYVPGLKRTIKISDVTYLRTAKSANMDWQVQARVLQPQEALRRIYQANKLM